MRIAIEIELHFALIDRSPTPPTRRNDMAFSAQDIESIRDFLVTMMEEIREFARNGELTPGEKLILESIESSLATLDAELDEREQAAG